MWRKLALLAAFGSTVALVEPKYERREMAGLEAPEYLPPTWVPSADDAVKLAKLDIFTVPPEDRCYVRYLFLQEGPEYGQAKRIASLLVNYTHNAAGVVLPVQLIGGYLLRIHLGLLYPRHQDLRRALVTYEDFQFDPTFARLITKDALDGGYKLPVRRVKKAVKRADWSELRLTKHPGGRLKIDDDHGTDYGVVPAGKYKVRYYFKGVLEQEYEDVDEFVAGEDVARFNSRAVDSTAYAVLQQETRSVAPVIDYRYFGHRGFRTVKDRLKRGNQYDTVFGGRYYELVGVRKSQKEGRTDLAQFFIDVGIPDAENLFERLRSDQGAILLRSLITGKPRDVWFTETPSGDGSITGDVQNRSIDIRNRVFRNMLNQLVDAREAIYWKRGVRGQRLNLFALYNGEGALQEVVPTQTVAADHRVPKPHPPILEAGVSCMACHSAEGIDGWQSVGNDSKLIARSIDTFGELRYGKYDFKFNYDDIDRIARRYHGDFQQRVVRNRDDLFEATLRSSYGAWLEGDDGQPAKEVPDQSQVCRLAALAMERFVSGYWYEGVGAKEALYEFGLCVKSEKQAVDLWKQLLTPNGQFEDVAVAAIADGRKLNRSDWALSRDFAAERVVRSPLYSQLRRRK